MNQPLLVQNLLPQWQKSPAAVKLWQISQCLPGKLAFVGGAVRDALLNCPIYDLDFLWTGDLSVLANLLQREPGCYVRLRPHYLTCQLHYQKTMIDIASPRRDTYTVPGAIPMIDKASLQEDSQRRDFTVNTLRAWIKNEKTLALEDPCAGLEDIEHGYLRPILPSTLLQDPVRLLRGARYLKRFHWQPQGHWQTGIDQAKQETTWQHVAQNRIWRELELIAQEEKPWEIFQQLKTWNIDVALFGCAIPAPLLAQMQWWRTHVVDLPSGRGQRWLIDFYLLNQQQPNLDFLEKRNVATHHQAQYEKLLQAIAKIKKHPHEPKTLADIAFLARLSV